MNLGIIGCGNISSIYCRNARRFPALNLVACADLAIGRAHAAAAEHHIARAMTPAELIADPDVDLVLNLTVPAVHGSVARAALEAGKHVYNEKPLTLSRGEGRELLTLANARGLRVGCAPDTFLGAALQTCRKVIDDGTIGEPLGAAGWMLGGGTEGWHPDPDFFYQPGAGPLFDMGPYYLTALTCLLGPVRRVTGSARVSFPERVITSQPRAGQTIKVNTPTHLAAVLDFASGPVGTLTTSFDVRGGSKANCFLEIYGAEGTLMVPDPNQFDYPIFLRLRGEKEWRQVPFAFPYAENFRGLGVADMAEAITRGRPHRANGEMAFHVLDIMHAVHDASREGRHVELTSTMQRPPAFPTGLTEGQVD